MREAEILTAGVLVPLAGLRPGARVERDAGRGVAGRSARALVELRNDGDISNETMNKVIRELDLEESRLEI